VTVARARAARAEQGDLALVVGGFAAAAVAGLGAALAGPLAVVTVLLLGVLAICAWRPVAAAYIYIASVLFLAGAERGTIPLLRLNEAVLLVVVAGVVAGAFARQLVGARSRTRLELRPSIDVPLAAFVLLATAWPLASLLLRGGSPGVGDLTALLPVVKLAVVFLLVRATVLEQDQLVRLIRIMVWSSVAIAAIAIAQTLGVPPVLDALSSFSPDETASEISARGSTTLASSIATGDVITIGLVLVVASGVRGILRRREQLAAGLVLGAGVLAAGQFSTWISALIAAALVLHMYPQLRRQALRVLPVVGLAILVGLPAFIGRVEGFGDGYGVPVSWLGRWDNLSTFFIPPLLDGANLLIGVSPDPVLAAPETWRDVIYLESGYLLLLWVGGVPLLAGFAWLSVAVLRRAAGLARRPDALGACGSTLLIAWILLLILSLLDPHLTLRGTGDFLFALLAVAAGVLDRGRAPSAAADAP
jgi:hypothetical protein